MYLLQLAFFNCIKMYCANDLGFFQGEKITPMLLFFSSRVSAAIGYKYNYSNHKCKRIQTGFQIIMQRIFVADFPTESIQMTVSILFKSSIIRAQFKFY